MGLEAWLPLGFKLPDGAKAHIVLFEGPYWQILETQGGGRALVVQDTLAQHWLDAGLIDEGSRVPASYPGGCEERGADHRHDQPD